jgi:cupin 2 domain-containing protein
MGNLFAGIPDELGEELIEVLADSPGARVERIVSRGHRSADGFWYKQDRDEFVLVMEGSAELEIEGEPSPRGLERGDWLVLPAGQRHRISRTAPGQDTVWVAVFMAPKHCHAEGG